MPRRTFTAGLGLLCACALTFSAGGAGAAAPAHRFAGGAMVRATAARTSPLQDATAVSSNWAGYAVTPASGHVTAVASTFVVPAAGLFLPGFAATWTGIGGYNTRDLIQAGVAEQSLPSNQLLGPQYYAWYELLPSGPVQLSGCMGDANCTVRPGDHLSVTISQVGTSNSWSIAMVDANHWMYAKTVSYVSSRSSAEWIVEAPLILGLQTLLAGIGKAHFGPTSTVTVSGTTESIGQGSPIQIDQTAPLGLFHEATSSSLAADGQSFTVCAYTQVCAGP